MSVLSHCLWGCLKRGAELYPNWYNIQDWFSAEHIVGAPFFPWERDNVIVLPFLPN